MRRQHHRLVAGGRAQPHRHPGEGDDLVLIAIERHPVARPQDRRPPAHRQPPIATGVAVRSGTVRSADSSCRHSR